VNRSTWISKTVIVPNSTGMHARPAAAFVLTASAFDSRITVVKGVRHADAKSIIGILTLAAERGSKLHIMADGSDAADAVDALVQLVEGGFNGEA